MPTVRSKPEPDTSGKPEPKTSRSKSRAKRGILIAACAMILFIGLYYLVLKDLDPARIVNEVKSWFETEDLNTYYLFRTPDYTENIFEDREYMELDRYLRFESGGVTYTITDENYAPYGPDVEMFAEYFACLIDGDTDGYNALFSDRYYQKNRPLEPFTAQKIYDMKIIRQSVRRDQAGDTYYYYKVEYKIRLNNGSFRMDVGEDACRPIGMVLSDREGSVKIDQILSYSYKDPNS